MRFYPRMSQYHYGRSSRERIINLHIEKLLEAVYLATSDDVQGLVAQGRTVSEAIEIARDVARRLFEAVPNRSGDMPEGTLRAILKESGITPNEFLRKS
jgi:predicted RNase H-like HicB family nuclease